MLIVSALTVTGLAVPALSAGYDLKFGKERELPRAERRAQPRVIEIAPLLPDRAQDGIGRADDAVQGRPDSNG